MRFVTGGDKVGYLGISQWRKAEDRNKKKGMIQVLSLNNTALEYTGMELNVTYVINYCSEIPYNVRKTFL